MSYGCNDNQNYFMEEGRTTSRVTNNPGGKSTICLGWDTNGSDDVDDVGTTTRRFRKREKEVTGKIGATQNNWGHKSDNTQVTGKIGTFEESSKADYYEEHEELVAAGKTSADTNKPVAGKASHASKKMHVSYSSFAPGGDYRQKTNERLPNQQPLMRARTPPGGQSSITFG
mmetsp:Transcript_15692/g.23275  ORF Transcript_15692/g.23275 Transcript_15692/m.23275 type:complete len:172 (+) Transcript_15692:161-676(+)